MRKIIHRFFTTVAIVFVGLLLADVAKACSCGDRGTMDLAEKAPNIVILKLQEVIKNDDGEKGDSYGGIKHSKLSVQKVFKGNLKVGQTLDFSQGGGGDCIWTFAKEDIQTEYLFYLADKPYKDGKWFGFWCSRSAPLKYAGDDLLYLEKMNKVRGKTRISGVIGQEIRPSSENGEIQINQLTGHKIKIVGKAKNIELTTDKNGAFEVYDLPAGIYEVIPQNVSGYKIYDESNGKSADSVKIYLPPKRHAQANIRFTIFNSISGRIIDNKGNPMESVGLNLEPAVGKGSFYFYEAAYSNKDGSFKFDGIPAGKYVLIANDEGKITADEPFATSYYPNTTNINEAKIITIDAGEHLKDFTITVNSIAKVVTVSGVFQFSDGKPVANEEAVFFKDVKNVSEIKNNVFPDSKEKTDKEGRFSFRMLEGEKGILYGSVYKGDLKGCANLQKVNSTNQRIFGLDFEHFNTDSVSINADRNLHGIVLKFPFPSCKKAKR